MTLNDVALFQRAPGVDAMVRLTEVYPELVSGADLYCMRRFDTHWEHAMLERITLSSWTAQTMRNKFIFDIELPVQAGERMEFKRVSSSEMRNLIANNLNANLGRSTIMKMPRPAVQGQDEATNESRYAILHQYKTMDEFNNC